MNNFDKLNDEIWNLDVTLAKIIFPMLLYYKIYSSSYGIPSDYIIGQDPNDEDMWQVEEDEWEYDLSEMVWAMKSISEGVRHEDFNRVVRGVSLFGKHFTDLWL